MHTYTGNRYRLCLSLDGRKYAYVLCNDGGFMQGVVCLDHTERHGFGRDLYVSVSGRYLVVTPATYLKYPSSLSLPLCPPC